MITVLTVLQMKFLFFIFIKCWKGVPSAIDSTTIFMKDMQKWYGWFQWVEFLDYVLIHNVSFLNFYWHVFAILACTWYPFLLLSRRLLLNEIYMLWFKVSFSIGLWLHFYFVNGHNLICWLLLFQFFRINACQMEFFSLSCLALFSLEL